MILDTIISAVGGILLSVVDLFTVALLLFYNAFLTGLERIIRFFNPGFCLNRFRLGQEKRSLRRRKAGGLMVFVLIVAVLGWMGVDLLLHRTVTLVAEDGAPLPLAAIAIQTVNGSKERRTDLSGRVAIPRFSTSSLTIKDPRYVEQTWPVSEIEFDLVASRTSFGEKLDDAVRRLGSRAVK